MHVKTISNTVLATVTLGVGQYGDKLTISRKGAVAPAGYGATAVYAPGSIPKADLVNHGKILGGPGAAPQYSSGDPGGMGIDFATPGAVANSGMIAGGSGGTGTPYGGVGGIGLEFTALGKVTNTGTILGGAGGNIYRNLAGGGFYGPFPGAGGVGIDLSAGGSLANHGLIEGGRGGTNGMYGHDASPYGGLGGTGVLFGPFGTVSNTGTIDGGAAGGGGGYSGNGMSVDSGMGVDLSAGGVLTNRGTIIGGFGGYADLSPNDGLNGGIGVYLGAAGSVTNNGVIAGGGGGLVYYYSGQGGVGVELAAGGTLINTGTITGGYSPFADYGTEPGGTGVDIVSGGIISNSGTITGGAGIASGLGVGGAGGAGIYLNGGTLINSGTIMGGVGDEGKGITGDAVQFGTAASTVIVDPGAVLSGYIIGHSNDTLVLGDGKTQGTLSGFGGVDAPITGLYNIKEDAGARWTLVGTLSHGAKIALGSDATLVLDGKFGPTVTFDGGNDLQLPKLSAFKGKLSGFGTGDLIDLPGVQATSLTYSNGTLTLLDANGSTLGALTFEGNYSQADFALQADGAKGTEIVYAGADDRVAIPPDFLPLAAFAEHGTLDTGLAEVSTASIRTVPVAPELLHAWHADMVGATMPSG